MKEKISLKDRDKKIIILIAMLVLLIIQVIDLLYWKNEKSGFFVDEFFTMESVSEYNISGSGNYMYYSDVWKDSEWMDMGALKDRLEFSADKSLFNRPLSENIKKLSQRKSYFAIVNVVCTILGDGYTIADASIYTNIVFFVLAQLLLFLLMLKMSSSYMTSFLVCIMHGFAGMTIGLVEYVRMYSMVDMLFILVVFLNYAIWTEKSLIRQILFEILLGMVLYIAYDLQQLIVVYMALNCMITACGMLIIREYRKMAAYAIPILLGGVIGGFKLGIFRMLAGVDESSVGHLGNFYEALHASSIAYKLDMVGGWYGIMWHQVFGSRAYMLFFVGVSALWIFWCLIKHNKPNVSDQFIYIILITAVLYFVFTIIVELDRMRYNQFSFVTLILVLAYMAGCAVNAIGKRKEIFGYIGAGIVLMAAAYGAFKTHRVTEIENIFIGDRELLETIRQDYSEWDSVVFHETDRNGDGHLYECIYNSGDSTRFRYLTQNDYGSFDAEDRDHFLLWTHAGNEYACDETIRSQGYDLERIGRSHISDIYKCIKK